MHSRKDLQVVLSAVIPSKKPTTENKQKDKVGKAAYNPVVKDLIGSRPTLEQTKKTISEPRKSKGKTVDYAALAGVNFKTKK